jgi:hypothetical protein
LRAITIKSGKILLPNLLTLASCPVTRLALHHHYATITPRRRNARAILLSYRLIKVLIRETHSITGDLFVFLEWDYAQISFEINSREHSSKKGATQKDRSNSDP